MIRNAIVSRSEDGRDGPQASLDPQPVTGDLLGMEGFQFAPMMQTGAPPGIVPGAFDLDISAIARRGPITDFHISICNNELECWLPNSRPRRIGGQIKETFDCAAAQIL